MKLTTKRLGEIIKEEIANLKNESKKSEVKSELPQAKTVEADELSDTLEKKIDYVKALGLEETRLRNRLQRVIEQKRRVLKQLGTL